MNAKRYAGSSATSVKQLAVSSKGDLRFGTLGLRFMEVDFPPVPRR